MHNYMKMHADGSIFMLNKELILELKHWLCTAREIRKTGKVYAGISIRNMPRYLKRLERRL
ncbi:hypothetical protein ASJ81_18715 [Methanosarcina spelaei]|uniref:Uncharacterized protein n=1 Tax=Methanosarcina spelaei TaxID=1036679 RepID=A0A2A2HV21_9EURY|nr:hypothetical protein ASJ81_18715 [Methanosarcina spelaei]